MATIPADWIERIVIFEASAPTSGSPVDQVPTNCIIGGYGGNVANKCNVYEPYDAFLAVQNNNVGYFNCSGSATRSCGYNPITRTNGPKWQDIDYLGVYMKVKRPMLTGIFGEEFETETASIVRLDRDSSSDRRTTPVARRLHGDEGAVIIEAALALPIIVILVLGILEYGMAFHEGIIIERGLTLVGRTVSNLGASPYADFETLRAVDCSCWPCRRRRR
ncbi:MAG: TadE/TadG family type IV pilus assembly protein [Acidimicrobiales bacterium]